MSVNSIEYDNSQKIFVAMYWIFQNQAQPDDDGMLRSKTTIRMSSVGQCGCVTRLE
jgi:hypothetical protein